MKAIRILLFVLSILLLLSACKKEEDLPDDLTPPVDDETPVELEVFIFSPENFPRMDGSPVTAPLAEAVASIMLGQSRQNVNELVLFSRTSQAFRNLADDLCDILIVGEPSPGVLNEISAQDFRHEIAPIALDALVFIVSASNPVNNLTSEQVKLIYSGEITGWQQVGGDDIEIMAFQRNEEAMSQVLMEKLVMDWQKMADAPMQTLPAYLDDWFLEDDQMTAIKGFDSSVNAIGYTMHHFAANMGMAEGYKILSIDGIAPSTDTIASGEYPFINPYYAVINSDIPADDPASILFWWLRTIEGQNFIASQGYVPYMEFGWVYTGWDVKTDDSHLTPYNSARSNFNRLHDAALPVLVPSDNYGMLLPYASSVTMNDGNIRATKYGFVAQRSGTVVTDPIFDDVFRAVVMLSNTKEFLPAYHLHIMLSDTDPGYFDGYGSMQAACGLDGSWITPFDYINIVFSEDVILAMHDYYTFDIDVYDYNGNLLYNVLDLEWADQIPNDSWSEFFTYTVSEGIGFVQLDDYFYAAMDILTGSIRETNFVDVLSFSDGLAAVKLQGDNNLWSFVDKNLDIVFESAFTTSSVFRNNRAVVTPLDVSDGFMHVINKQGDILYSLTSDHHFTISHNFDGIGFTVYSDRSAQEYPIMLTNDFHEIAYPTDAPPAFSLESTHRYIGNGWYVLFTEGGNWLISESEIVTLPENRYVDELAGDFSVFREYSSDYSYYKRGVMTKSGQTIIEADIRMSVYMINVANEAGGFIQNTNTRTLDNSQGFIGDFYNRRAYNLFDLSGQLLSNDLGILSYDEASGLLYVQGSDYFAWLNKQGECLISIPSMAYSYD